jgi:hypothetical protein
MQTHICNHSCHLSPRRNDDGDARCVSSNCKLDSRRWKSERGGCAPFEMALRVRSRELRSRQIENSQHRREGERARGCFIFLPISRNKRSELPNICIALNIVQIKLGVASVQNPGCSFILAAEISNSRFCNNNDVCRFFLLFSSICARFCNRFSLWSCLARCAGCYYRAHRELVQIQT